jgi:hypothetical protein
MQVVHTLEPPPKSGSRALATIGCTPKSRAAARNTATVKRMTMPVVSQPFLEPVQ